MSSILKNRNILVTGGSGSIGQSLVTKALEDGAKSIKVFSNDENGLYEMEQTFTNKKIEFIAVGTGPGSFTGTRVGAMTAQALAFGWNIPLIGFSSTLLPNLSEIAQLTYQSFLSGASSSQIELVYISPTT